MIYLIAFFGIWLGVAIFARRNRKSWLIAIGGGLVAAVFAVGSIPLIGKFFGLRVQKIAVQHCGEAIVVEACEQTATFPLCTIKNIASVPAHGIGAWAYDSAGTRVGSPAIQSDLNQLAPGAQVRTKLLPDAVNAYAEVSRIVLCSVDPSSPVGSRRFGIGERAIN